MTTYNSYAEAKIANPESDVYSDGDLFFTSAVKTFMCDSAKCNPTDHCKTLGWLRDNHGAEFAGDIILGHVSRNVIRITQDTIKDYDDNCLILRAAALEEKTKPYNKDDLIEKLLDGFNRITAERDYENAYDIACEMLDLESELKDKHQEKPKRVKVEYVMHNVNEDGGKFWEVARDWSEDNCEFRFMRGNGDYELIDSNEELLMLYTNRKLYRKVETEIDERQEFIDAACEILDWNIQKTIGALFDAGCRFTD